MLKKLLKRIRLPRLDNVAAGLASFASRHRNAGRALLFAGGFALVVMLMATGVLLNIGMRRKKILF